MYLLRKDAYRDISHIIKAHTISNKLISKLSAQKKGGKSYDATNMFQISVINGQEPPGGQVCVGGGGGGGLQMAS